MCVCIKAFDMLFYNYKNTSYQLSLGHLDHEELLIRHVLELQIKCFTKVFIKTSSNITENRQNIFNLVIDFFTRIISPSRVNMHSEQVSIVFLGHVVSERSYLYRL